MKTTYLAIILLLMSFAASCHHAARVSALLDQAEEQMAERPDSSLILLESIDPASLSAKADKAKYALLFTQAQDKNYIEVKDDSLISFAVEYYGENDDSYNLMLSLFYQGIAKENAHSYPQAIVLFNRSMDLAVSMGDSFWMGKNAEQISTIYDTTRRREEAVRYAKIAHDCYSRTDRKTFIDFSLLEIARIKLNGRHYQEAYQIADSACRFVFSDSDAYLRGHAMDVMGEAAFFLKDYKQAIALLKPVYEESGSTYAASLLGMAYIQSGDMANATEIYDYMPESAKGPAEMNFRRSYYNAMGLQDQHAATESALMLLLDSIYTDNLNENFSHDLNELRKQDAAAAEMHMRYQRIENLALVLALVLVIIALAFLIYMVKRRIAKEESRANRAIEVSQNLERMLTEKSSEADFLKNTLDQEQLQHILDIAALCNGLDIEEMHAAKNKKKIAEELGSIAHALTVESSIQVMEKEVNAKYSGIVDCLDAELGGMRHKDRVFYLFSVMGFSSSTIAFLMKEESLEPVYNRRARLKRQIKKLSNPKKYLKFLDNKA